MLEDGVADRHSVELTDHRRISSPVRRYLRNYDEVFKREFYNMLKAWIIKPACCLWDFLVVISQKNNDDPRSCDKYRARNKRMKGDIFSISNNE